MMLHYIVNEVCKINTRRRVETALMICQHVSIVRRENKKQSQPTKERKNESSYQK